MNSSAQSKIVHKQQLYIQPQHSPITPFCTSLTGISDDTVKEGVSFIEAMRVFDEYCEQAFTKEGKTFCLVVHGAWDLVCSYPSVLIIWKQSDVFE